MEMHEKCIFPAVMIIICSVMETFTAVQPPEKVLITELIRNYSMLGPYGRPIRNVSQALKLTLALHLVQILDLDESNQVLTTSVRMNFNWTDTLIGWSPGNYGGVKEVAVKPGDIWVPDLILDNSVAEEEYIDKVGLLKVFHNGTVVWAQRKVYRTSCLIEMDYYPFDEQVCQLVARSATYSYKEVLVLSKYKEARIQLQNEYNWTMMTFPTDPCFEGNNVERVRWTTKTSQHHILQNYVPCSEWDVKDVQFKEDTADQSPFTVMRYTITLKRKTVFFTYILLLPCIVLTMLTMVIFWLPPERPDKTTLAKAIFGSFTVLLLVLVGSMPSTASSVPILGVYYFFNMTMTAMSICVATLVVNISRSNKSKPGVPRWLRTIAVDTLGRIFGVHGPPKTSKVKQHLRLKREARLRAKILVQTSQTDSIAGAELGDPSFDTASEAPDLESLGLVKAQIVDPMAVETISERARLETLERIELVLKDTRESIKELVKHAQETERKHDLRDEKALEWHSVGVAIDRFFFFLYFTTIMILCLVSFAILIPRSVR